MQKRYVNKMNILTGGVHMSGYKWKVAVIGCGMFAHAQYLPNISKEANAECVAVCDIVFERAKQAAEKYGIPNAYPNIYEMLEKFQLFVQAHGNDKCLISVTKVNAAPVGSVVDILLFSPVKASLGGHKITSFVVFVSFHSNTSFR